MTDRLEQSAAYLAMPHSAKRVLGAVLAAIDAAGGDAADVSYHDLIYGQGLPSASWPCSLKMIRYLGFVSRPARRRRADVMASEVARGFLLPWTKAERLKGLVDGGGDDRCSHLLA
jgi:hypothetical protein